MEPLICLGPCTAGVDVNRLKRTQHAACRGAEGYSEQVLNRFRSHQVSRKIFRVRTKGK